jgi:hypothetical protein
MASALAALARLFKHHGLPLGPDGIRRATGLAQPDLDPVLLLYTARQCGFEALPLSGGFDDLPELALPAIVVLHGNQYRVLETLHADGVTLDNATRLCREEFEKQWTGDVFAVTPDPDAETQRQTLLANATPLRRAARTLGLAPFQPARLLFLAALALIAVSPLIGFNLAASLWMAAYPRGCSKCRANASLSGGIPLPWLGAATYAALLAFPNPLLLWAAAGAHAGLVARLAQARSACYPCLAIALSAWTATALTNELHPLIAAAAAISTYAVLAFANRRADQQTTKALEQIVANANNNEAPRLVVYTRRQCPVCFYFKTLVKPALAEVYTVDEHDAASLPITVPLFVLTGPKPRILPEMATDEMFDTLAAALEPAA